MSREELEDIQDEVESTLSVSLSMERQPAALRKDVYRSDIKNALMYSLQVLATCCLVLLQSNMSVSNRERR
ncbi:hypothetical protein OH492_28540 [Vibrio chagasii]|nr:hypothetical protein [Vibrio chagasii]